MNDRPRAGIRRGDEVDHRPGAMAEGVTKTMRFAELRYLWGSDLYRHYGRADLWTYLKMLLIYWEPPGAKYAFLLRLCAYFGAARPRALFLPLFVAARVVLKHWEYKYHIRIPPAARIGPGLYIGHFGDVGVNSRAVIGANCNISQGVSVGQASRGRRQGYPVIGDNVFIGPGAKVIGRVRIGDNVAIGANCVVTRDIPDNAVVVGVPGRVISYVGSTDYILNADYDRHRGCPGRPAAGNGRDAAVIAQHERPSPAREVAPAVPDEAPDERLILS